MTLDEFIKQAGWAEKDAVQGVRLEAILYSPDREKFRAPDYKARGVIWVSRTEGGSLIYAGYFEDEGDAVSHRYVFGPGAQRLAAVIEAYDKQQAEEGK